MKKTLITMLALAGVAGATTLEDAVATFEGESLASTVSVNDWTSDEISVAVTLDVDAVKNCINTTWAAGSGIVTTVINVQGTWNSATEGRTDTVGLNFNGSSKSKYGTPYMQATSPNGNSAAIKADGVSETLTFNGETDWDDIVAISMMLTHNGATTGALYCAVKHADGSYTTYAGSNSGIKFGSSTVFTANGTLTNLNTDMVTGVYVFDNVVNQADSLAITQALATPEPTTATLSLLALAGLCARRRRH